ncbi:AAA family ATPase [Nitrosopumilus maritimus]|uniref:ATPase associated with various cellular activities AAA_3 n=1 Tax=Nitrosopumilus maritimus (strain SCM1) TaxID=436308 RepID=A9A1M4_NITMS|nr:MoxR family ATPase [Nitrosopumilus maritimus]ABX13539.1 ATPase associated with various cellular activities AAA_3 [Nitrosopumilus maritimus SCM1]
MALRENHVNYSVSNEDIKKLSEQAQKYAKKLNAVFEESHKVVIGQQDALQKILISIIADGHVLLESVPGLAKTLMVKTMAQIFNVDHVRIQFTPDLLPADILGTKIYKNASGSFVTQKGPIFHNFVLADEINRAPPKVQSALLEAMQERNVSIHGDTFELKKPFLVLATQNPIENEGTYKLPEAQVDRFALKILIDYPSKQEELEIIEKNSSEQEDKVNTIISPEEILEIQKFNEKIYADKVVTEYIADIVNATRTPKDYDLDLENMIEFGASPRASIWLMRTAKANAMLNGRGFIIPEDVKAVAHEVLRHRIILTFEAEANGITSDKVIDFVLEKINPP